MSEADLTILATAFLSIVESPREYLEPGGLGKDEFINRVLAAVDNEVIAPVVLEYEREVKHG